MTLHQIDMILDLDTVASDKNLLSSLSTKEEIKTVEVLNEWVLVSHVWKNPGPSPVNMLNIFVKLPATSTGEEKLFLSPSTSLTSFCHSVLLQSLALLTVSFYGWIYTRWQYLTLLKRDPLAHVRLLKG